MIKFIITWAVSYILIMFCMCLDNLCWIPADFKWYGTNEWRKYFRVLFTIRNKEYIFPNTTEGWKIIKGRIIDVLTHQYDIIPALVTSFILNLIIIIF